MADCKMVVLAQNGNSHMRQEAAFFEGRDPQLIYIAKRLSDAASVEELLNRSGVDYGVEADMYTGGLVFRSERVGAFFYVLPEAGDTARAVLLGGGWKAFLAGQVD